MSMKNFKNKEVKYSYIQYKYSNCKVIKNLNSNKGLISTNKKIMILSTTDRDIVLFFLAGIII